jgi:CRISPR/Cas system-associated exonuclease Cas4 (RecB family)
MKKRVRNLFDPASAQPFKLSRTKLENFIKCPRCFYLDRRLGVDQPAGFPFNLNSAVDTLLKKEFDTYRIKGEAHPWMKELGINAVPFRHPELEKWRENFTGIQFHHEPSNFLLFGAIDDLWQTPEGELIVVDYKATSKEAEVTLDSAWQDGYKRQMEIYQWLFRKNGFKVLDTGYFVYTNGRRDRAGFFDRLEFKTVLIPYLGNSGWVDEALVEARECLASEEPPPPGPDCEFCRYRFMAREVEEKI